jgi:hypothetical protein
MGIGHLVIKGAICGLLAGLVAGAFAFIFAEPLIDHAIATEYQRAAAEAAARGATLPPEVFSRQTQRAGLVVATAAVSTAFGALFGMLFYGLSRQRQRASHWALALSLGTALFLGYYLVPFIRYPANPPGVGDPNTIAQRSSATLLATVIGVLAVAAAWRLNAWLREREVFEPVRHLAATVIFLAMVGGTYSILPDNTDTVQVPATLLWNFRLLSVTTQLLLWGTLAVSFGLWVEWSARRRSSIPGGAQTRAAGAGHV